MAGLRSLVKDTAIYGVSSIVGRFLNWRLVPLYTYVFARAEYGIVTNIYAYVAILLIILTYGMETGFFRFSNHERWDNPDEVYSTSLISLGSTSLGFILLACVFAPTIAGWLDIPGHASYITMMGITIAIDAFCCIPFSYLRYKKRPIRFATIKLVNIAVNIGLNLFFILACPKINEVAPQAIGWFYNANFGIGYIFLSNLISSFVVLLMLLPNMRVQPKFNGKLLGEMLRYSFPLLILGIAGMMNQTIDKILLPIVYHGPLDAQAELGIYGACYKIAIVMVMFIQAFRFAYEPIIFERSKRQGEDRRQGFADAMKLFVVFSLFIFLGVMFFLNILKHFISPAYYSGLEVVPIIMLAEFFFGIFFNLSLWYKLTDRTIWGTYLTIGGLAVTLTIQLVFIPQYSYMACAWGGFFCYLVMMVASYFLGQHYYPIDYPLRRIGLYALLAAVLYVVGMYIAITPWAPLNYAVRGLLLLAYVAVVVVKEKPFAALRRKPVNNG